MLSKIRKFIVNRLLSYDLVLEGESDKIDVIKFIQNLRPFETDKQLIRLGPDKDGGYLVPDDLEGIKACFSPGVGEISEFEKECADRGMDIFLADASVDAPSINNTHFKFLKKFVGPMENDQFITLDAWVAKSNLPDKSDLLLQMDIEGWEFLALTSCSEDTLNRFRIITLEFHRLNNLWNPEFYFLAKTAVSKLLKNHTCVHVHPNNFDGNIVKNEIEIPRFIEYTFLRNDRIGSKKPQTSLPHPLDKDNYSNKPSLALPSLWYNPI